MGSFSIWHLLVLALVVFILFGRGRVSDLMGDVAKGIKNFREGLKDDADDQQRPSQAPPRVLVSEHREPERAETMPADSKEQVGR
ncbi:MAG: twin-arginine translocase TatA/TatE family subunit [Alphaproteobacteria bacterium]|nr:twin-arginine translocase TatA/TatE family subunit [Alphaproteobacteria bacterium]